MRGGLTKQRVGRVLLVGTGDVAWRLVAALRQRGVPRKNILGITSTPSKKWKLRQHGCLAHISNLDRRAQLRIRAADTLIHLAPPKAEGKRDWRTARLATSIERRQGLYRRGKNRPTAHAPFKKIIYISTTGVYGDCAGERFDERRRVRPANARAVRRVDAERRMARLANDGQTQVHLLRVPGIYAADRLPLARLRAGTPALMPADDVYTNHIHADDLAGVIAHIARSGKKPRRAVEVLHAVDASDMKMGEYLDAVADRFGLPRPPRVPRTQLAEQVSPMMLSFMQESRRLVNTRLLQRWRFRLRWPTVGDFLAGGALDHQTPP
jgi:nucleoside-diphosphate-sugar epimerase